jgi:hypothetical protein
MSTTIFNGRLGNQIIRNLALSIIAEKFDLHVSYYNNELIDELGIKLFSGNCIFNSTITLDDDNYFSIYNYHVLDNNLDPNLNFFQTKEITIFLYDYLRSDKIKSNIIDKNPFNDRYNSNNDLFIHVRLTDAEHNNPGANYYIETVKSIEYNNIYISSDDKSHSIVQEIIEHYPTTTIIEYDEIKTFQFGSTCKNVILSHGTFSAIIGYLSFFSVVHYPEFEPGKIWHGDIFSIKGWIEHDVT